MNITELLLYIAGGALALDITLFILFSNYRKHGAHIIAMMAYVIVLTELLYALESGTYETQNFKIILQGVLIIGFFFLLEYCITTIRTIYRSDKQNDSGQITSEIDNIAIEKLQKELAQLKTELSEHLIREGRLYTEREIRIESNKRYEENLDLEEPLPATKDGFLVWTHMIDGFETERGLILERKLHNICEKIAACLTAEELDVIYQINRKTNTEAAKFFDLTEDTPRKI